VKIRCCSDRAERCPRHIKDSCGLFARVAQVHQALFWLAEFDLVESISDGRFVANGDRQNEHGATTLRPDRLGAFYNRIGNMDGVAIGEPRKQSSRASRHCRNPIGKVQSAAIWIGGGHGSSTPIASVWTRDAEASASSDASASCYGVEENVRVFPVVKAPLKLIQVERQVFFANVMKAAHDTALEKRPERFDCVGMYDAANVFILAALDASCARPLSTIVS
jgi:hypothetical protein